MKNPFEDDQKDTHCLEYYVGVDGPSIVKVNCPENLWTILDRVETMIMDDPIILEKQKEFLLSFVSRWMGEIERYCYTLESE
jgi:hypothetical protein